MEKPSDLVAYVTRMEAAVLKAGEAINKLKRQNDMLMKENAELKHKILSINSIDSYPEPATKRSRTKKPSTPSKQGANVDPPTTRLTESRKYTSFDKISDKDISTLVRSTSHRQDAAATKDAKSHVASTQLFAESGQPTTTTDVISSGPLNQSKNLGRSSIIHNVYIPTNVLAKYNIFGEGGCNSWHDVTITSHGLTITHAQTTRELPVNFSISILLKHCNHETVIYASNWLIQQRPDLVAKQLYTLVSNEIKLMEICSLVDLLPKPSLTYKYLMNKFKLQNCMYLLQRILLDIPTGKRFYNEVCYSLTQRILAALSNRVSYPIVRALCGQGQFLTNEVSLGPDMNAVSSAIEGAVSLNHSDISPEAVTATARTQPLDAELNNNSNINDRSTYDAFDEWDDSDSDSVSGAKGVDKNEINPVAETEAIAPVDFKDLGDLCIGYDSDSEVGVDFNALVAAEGQTNILASKEAALDLGLNGSEENRHQALKVLENAELNNISSGAEDSDIENGNSHSECEDTVGNADDEGDEVALAETSLNNDPMCLQPEFISAAAVFLLMQLTYQRDIDQKVLSARFIDDLCSVCVSSRPSLGAVLGLIWSGAENKSLSVVRNPYIQLMIGANKFCTSIKNKKGANISPAIVSSLNNFMNTLQLNHEQIDSAVDTRSKDFLQTLKLALGRMESDDNGHAHISQLSSTNYFDINNMNVRIKLRLLVRELGFWPAVSTIIQSTQFRLRHSAIRRFSDGTKPAEFGNAIGLASLEYFADILSTLPSELSNFKKTRSDSAMLTHPPNNNEKRTFTSLVCCKLQLIQIGSDYSGNEVTQIYSNQDVITALKIHWDDTIALNDKHALHQAATELTILHLLLQSVLHVDYDAAIGSWRSGAAGEGVPLRTLQTQAMNLTRSLQTLLGDSWLDTKLSISSSCHTGLATFALTADPFLDMVSLPHCTLLEVSRTWDTVFKTLSPSHILEHEMKIGQLLNELASLVIPCMTERLAMILAESARAAITAIDSMSNQRSNYLASIDDDLHAGKAAILEACIRVLEGLPSPFGGLSCMRTYSCICTAKRLNQLMRVKGIASTSESNSISNTSLSSGNNLGYIERLPSKLKQGCTSKQEIIRNDCGYSRRLPTFVVNSHGSTDRWRYFLLLAERTGLICARVGATGYSSDADSHKQPLGNRVSISDVSVAWETTWHAARVPSSNTHFLTPAVSIITAAERERAANHIAVWRAIAHTRKVLASLSPSSENKAMTAHNISLSRSRGNNSNGLGLHSNAVCEYVQVFSACLLGNGWNQLQPSKLRSSSVPLSTSYPPPLLCTNREGSNCSDWYLVLEDGAQILGLAGSGYRSSTFADAVREYTICHAPPDFDIIYLGGGTGFGGGQSTMEGNGGTKKIVGSTGRVLTAEYHPWCRGYVIRGRAVELLLTKLPVTAPVDRWIARLVFEECLQAYVTAVNLVEHPNDKQRRKYKQYQANRQFNSNCE